MVRVPPWQCPSSAPAPPHAAPGGSGQLGYSQEEVALLDAQPLPRVLKPAASKAAEFTAFDHPGVPLQVICFPDIAPANIHPDWIDEIADHHARCALVGVCVSGEHVFVAEDHPGSRLWLMNPYPNPNSNPNLNPIPNPKPNPAPTLTR